MVIFNNGGLLAIILLFPVAKWTMIIGQRHDLMTIDRWREWASVEDDYGSVQSLVHSLVNASLAPALSIEKQTKFGLIERATPSG